MKGKRDGKDVKAPVSGLIINTLTNIRCGPGDPTTTAPLLWWSKSVPQPQALAWANSQAKKLWEWSSGTPEHSLVGQIQGRSRSYEKVFLNTVAFDDINAYQLLEGFQTINSSILL